MFPGEEPLGSSSNLSPRNANRKLWFDHHVNVAGVEMSNYIGGI